MMRKKNNFKEALRNNNKPYLIAETSYIFEGNPKYLIKIIDKLKKKKCCDAIKYHILINIDKYATRSHPVYNLIKKFLLPQKEWINILKKTKKAGFENIILVDDIKGIVFVKKNINLVDAVELHAIALNNIEMLERIKKLNIPIILGIGGSEIKEMEFAIKFLKNKDILLMHGFQNFPTKYEFVNFNKMKRIGEKFNLLVGYADHCAWNHEYNELVTLAGFMAGANIIEKHVILKPGEKRTDFNSAISIDMLCSIKKKMEVLNKTKGDGSFKINEYEKIYGKNGPMKFTVVANKELKKGDIIKKEDITFKRTKEENTISQKEFLDLIGGKVKKGIKKDELVNWGNVHRK